jgi:ABC-type methionine transport system ATPase subunit
VASIKIHLTFPAQRVQEPIIYQLGRDFKVVTNIRKANVTESEGWVDLELTGESDEIEKAIEALGKKGVRVDPIEGNVLE